MSREEPLPREFVTLWVPESQARRRVNLEALSHFVAALGREVDRQFPERVPDCDVDIACALLPNGRLLLDIQMQPSELFPRIVPMLRERLSALACPPINEHPVAFSYRKVVGGGAPQPHPGFRVPFLRWAEEWPGGSLDDLVMAAAERTGLWSGEDPRSLYRSWGLPEPPTLEPTDSPAPSSAKTAPRSALPPLASFMRRSRGATRGLWQRFWDWLREHFGKNTTESSEASSSATLPTVNEPEPTEENAAESEPTASDRSTSDEPSLAEINERIERQPSEMANYLLRAEWWQRSGDFPAAIADYSHVLSQKPEDIDTLLSRGAAYCAGDDTQHGLADFNRILALEPNHTLARFNRGLVYLELDAYDAAVEDFTRALEHDRWNARLYLGRGRARALLKQYREAELDFDMSIRLDPHTDEPYVLRGALCRFTQPFPECTARAIADFTRAIEISPDQPLYYLQRAENHWAIDDYTQALTDCQRALELDPQLIAAYALRGAVHVSLEKYEEAIADCTRAIDGGAEGSHVLLSRAEAYQNLEQFEEALRDAEQAVDLAPHMAATWKCRSLIRVRLGQLDEALTDLNEALRLEPDQPVLLCHRAALQRHRGNATLAIEDCEKALAQSPEFMPAFLIRAGSWEDQDERDRAAADFDELVRLAPDDPQAYIERGNFWMRWDDCERARADYDRALTLKPTDWSCRFHRGQIHTALGDYDAALADFNAVIEATPQFSAVYARRGQVWLLMGNETRADEDYTEAVRLDPDAAETIEQMRRLDEAQAQFEREEYERTIELTTEMIEAAPDNSLPALHLRASAYWYSEQFVEALADYDALLNVVEEPAGIYASRGQVLMELGEFTEALQNLNKAIALGAGRQPPRHLAFAYSGRALAHAGLDHHEAADRDFAASITLWPLNAWVYYNQGRVYAEQGAVHSARLCFRLALQLASPRLTSRQRERAKAYLNRHP